MQRDSVNKNFLIQQPVRSIWRFQLALMVAMPALVGIGVFVVAWSIERALLFTLVGTIAVFALALLIGFRVHLLALVLPALAVIVAVVACTVLRSQGVGTFLLSLVTVLVVFRYGPELFEHHHWTNIQDSLAEPQLRKRLNELSTRPSILILLVILSIIASVPLWHTVTFALLILLLFSIGLALLSLSRGGIPLENTYDGIRVFWGLTAQFLGHQAKFESDREAIDVRRRRRHFAAMWLCISATLCVGLSYCVPYELFASWYEPDFNWQIPPHDRPPFAWLVSPFSIARHADSGYLWAIVVGVVLSALLPYFILFLIYLPGCLRLATAYHLLAMDARRQGRQVAEYARENVASSPHFSQRVTGKGSGLGGQW